MTDPRHLVGSDLIVQAVHSWDRASIEGCGKVIAYSMVPQYCIQTSAGGRFWWREDLVEVAPAEAQKEPEEMPEQVTLDDLLPVDFMPETGNIPLMTCIRCGSLVRGNGAGEAREAHERWHAAIENLTVTGTFTVLDPQGEIPPITAWTPRPIERNSSDADASAHTEQLARDDGWRIALAMALNVSINTPLETLIDMTNAQQSKVDYCNREHAGLSRGETVRLRRIEQALIEAGAPDHSERDDPGGLVVEWIDQRRAELQRRDDLLAELRKQLGVLDKTLNKIQRDKITDLAKALQIEDTIVLHWRDLLRRVERLQASATASATDTDLATKISNAIHDPGKFVERTRTWDGYFRDWDYETVAAWGTRAVMSVLRQNQDTPEIHGPVTDQVLSDLLLLVNVTVTPEQLAAWTPEQREQAANWAGLVHLDASDNDVDVPERPAFLDGGTPGAPITGFTAPEVAVERWRAEAEVCPSLYLTATGHLVACELPKVDDPDLHQAMLNGNRIAWRELEAVPSPWPIDQEPPDGINVLYDLGEADDGGPFLPYLCRLQLGNQWVWNGKPGKPSDVELGAEPWAAAVLKAEGDLIVVRP